MERSTIDRVTVLLEMKCHTHRVKLTPCRLILGMI